MGLSIGNICRSPTAEAVFTSLVNERGIKDRFIVDSCGTGGGNPDWYLEGSPSTSWGFVTDSFFAQMDGPITKGIQLMTVCVKQVSPHVLTPLTQRISCWSWNHIDIHVSSTARYRSRSVRRFCGNGWQQRPGHDHRRSLLGTQRTLFVNITRQNRPHDGLLFQERIPVTTRNPRSILWRTQRIRFCP